MLKPILYWQAYYLNISIRLGQVGTLPKTNILKQTIYHCETIHGLAVIASFIQLCSLLIGHSIGRDEKGSLLSTKENAVVDVNRRQRKNCTFLLVDVDWLQFSAGPFSSWYWRSTGCTFIFVDIDRLHFSIQSSGDAVTVQFYCTFHHAHSIVNFNCL